MTTCLLPTIERAPIRSMFPWKLNYGRTAAVNGQVLFESRQLDDLCLPTGKETSG